VRPRPLFRRPHQRRPDAQTPAKKSKKERVSSPLPEEETLPVVIRREEKAHLEASREGKKWHLGCALCVRVAMVVSK
jgi:hypothetical protein